MAIAACRELAFPALSSAAATPVQYQLAANTHGAGRATAAVGPPALVTARFRRRRPATVPHNRSPAGTHPQAQAQAQGRTHAQGRRPVAPATAPADSTTAAASHGAAGTHSQPSATSAVAATAGTEAAAP